MDPATLMIIGTIASTAVSVLGALQQGEAETQTATYNTAVAKRNQRVSENDAARVRQTALANAKLFNKEKRLRAGAIRARGGQFLSLDALESSMLDEELEEASILQHGEQTAQQHLQQAELDKSAGSLAAHRGATAQRATKVTVASTLLSGAGTLAQQNMALPAGNPLKIT